MEMVVAMTASAIGFDYCFKKTLTSLNSVVMICKQISQVTSYGSTGPSLQHIIDQLNVDFKFKLLHKLLVDFDEANSSFESYVHDKNLIEEKKRAFQEHKQKKEKAPKQLMEEPKNMQEIENRLDHSNKYTCRCRTKCHCSKKKIKMIEYIAALDISPKVMNMPQKVKDIATNKKTTKIKNDTKQTENKENQENKKDKGVDKEQEQQEQQEQQQQQEKENEKVKDKDDDFVTITHDEGTNYTATVGFLDLNDGKIMSWTGTNGKTVAHTDTHQVATQPASKYDYIDSMRVTQFMKADEKALISFAASASVGTDVNGIDKIYHKGELPEKQKPMLQAYPKTTPQNTTRFVLASAQLKIDEMHMELERLLRLQASQTWIGKQFWPIQWREEARRLKNCAGHLDEIVHILLKLGSMRVFPV